MEILAPLSHFKVSLTSHQHRWLRKLELAFKAIETIGSTMKFRLTQFWTTADINATKHFQTLGQFLKYSKYLLSSY